MLPETFPGVRFDVEGVCNFCRDFNRDRLAGQKAEYRRRFKQLVKEHTGKSEYDAILSYSGGKDSTYTLMKLKQDFHLNVLAFTMDNGFMSGRAYENIRIVTGRLGVDHLLFKPRFDVMRTIFAGCARRNIFPPKTLERASSICTACMSIVRFSVLRTAIEKKIPFLVFGWSPGQAPITASVMKNNVAFLKLMQKNASKPLHELVGDAVNPYFLRPEHLRPGRWLPYNIHPLVFLDYDEKTIFNAIDQIGWKPPQDTDAQSTNCLINSFANDVHKKRYGFHPYVFELAGLVRQGYLKRSTAQARLEQKENAELIDSIRASLGLDG
ncbi:MAG: hypothetical protein JW884_04195 [Deltaproteobacteria bacterium]|nr:hypothetical protein [Deltaproteobacteria bacterium]